MKGFVVSHKRAMWTFYIILAVLLCSFVMKPLLGRYLQNDHRSTCERFSHVLTWEFNRELHTALQNGSTKDSVQDEELFAQMMVRMFPRMQYQETYNNVGGLEHFEVYGACRAGGIVTVHIDEEHQAIAECSLEEHK